MICIILKYFTICYTSNLFLLKIGDVKKKPLSLFFNITITLLFSFFIYFSRQKVPYLTIFFIFVYFFLLIILNLKLKLERSISLAIISTTIGYIFNSISIIIISPFVFIVFQIIDYTKNKLIVDVISEVFISLVAFFLYFLLSKNKRIMSGSRQLFFTKNIDIFLYISIVLFVSTTFFNPDNELNIIYLIPAVLTIILPLTAIFLLKSKIMQIYLEKLKSKEVLELKEELAILKEDNEIMSKQIHKDNKLLPIMQLSLMEYSKEYGETEKIKEFQNQLEILMKERYGLIQKTTNKNITCNISSTDAIFQYYNHKAEQENVKIEYDISNKALSDIKVSTNDLNTLLCDLLENAFISVRTEKNKSIFLKIKSKNGLLDISIFDSGQPFAREVLEKLGKERITTHSDTGGSGIGLITIFEILNKYKGNFSINKCSSNDKYTKGIFLTFDA